MLPLFGWFHAEGYIPAINPIWQSKLNFPGLKKLIRSAIVAANRIKIIARYEATEEPDDAAIGTIKAKDIKVDPQDSIPCGCNLRLKIHNLGGGG